MKHFLKSLAYLGVYFVIQLLIQMVFMLFGSLSGLQTEHELMEFSMNHLLLMTILSNIVAIFLFGFFKIKIQKKNIKNEWNLIPVTIKTYIFPSLFIFLLSFAWAFATYDLSFANTAQIQTSVDFYSTIFPGFGVIMMAFSLLIAQPIMEEILCRGILLNQLRNSMPTWIAVLISSLLFGIIHLMAGGIWLVIGATLMGICFGIIFVKTNSLYVAIVAHAFANLPDFIMSYLPHFDFGTRNVLALVLAILSIMMIVLFCKKPIDAKTL